MSYEINKRCKVCNSPYKLEIEKLITQKGGKYREVTEHLRKDYGFHVTASALNRHMTNHFQFVDQALVEVKKQSRELFNENLVDASERASKLYGMIHASYEYIVAHYDELELDTALKMLMGSIDQLNKMEGTGAFAGSEFLLKFLETIDGIKRPKTVQQQLNFITDSDGNAIPVDTNGNPITQNVDNPVENPDQNLPPR